MAVRTWVGRFSVVEGRVEEDGPWLGSLIRQRADDEPDELYVLIQPATRGSEEYTSQLVDVITQLYNRDPLSLTGALMRSLRAAHEHLREWNRKSLKEHQVGAGTSCLALRAADAYLAQAGPSLAYVLTAGGEFRRLTAERTDFEHALGIDEDFEPHLRRIQLEPGDLVLVASTQLDEVAPADHVRRILERGADDALPELYLLCRDRSDFSLVLLSCFEEPEALPEFLARGPGDAGAAAAVEGESGAAGDDGGGVATIVEAPPAGPVTRPQASVAAADIGGFELPKRPIAEQVREITESTAPPPVAGVRLRGGNATPRYKRATGAGPLPRFQVPKLAVFGALAILVLGALIWWQLPRSVQESREEKFVALLADARQANARAQATADGAAKRELLNTAEAKLVEAEKIHGDNGELLALRADVDAALGVLNAVYEVREFAPIADLAQQVTGSLSVTQSVTGGGSAFFLDATDGRVLRLALDGASPPETILEAGEPAGFVTAGQPAEIAWAEQTQSLIILDDQRQAFAYFPDRGALPLTVRGADGWSSLDAITSTGGNLYVLDVKGNQVWRYLPGQGGFDSERTGLLDSTALTDALELAVGQEVYILDKELGIRRFRGGAEMPFALAGIDMPLVSPASLSVLPGSNRIVVADRGNKRIVVASPEGVFLRQIVSPSFTDLRALSVDEGTGTMYVLNGDTLLRAAFPP
jgi:hypothetical protein